MKLPKDPFFLCKRDVLHRIQSLCIPDSVGIVIYKSALKDIVSEGMREKWRKYLSLVALVLTLKWNFKTFPCCNIVCSHLQKAFRHYVERQISECFLPAAACIRGARLGPLNGVGLKYLLSPHIWVWTAFSILRDNEVFLYHGMAYIFQG